MMFSINSGQNLQNDYGIKNIVSLQLDYDSTWKGKLIFLDYIIQ